MTLQQAIAYVLKRTEQDRAFLRSALAKREI